MAHNITMKITHC